MSKDIPKKNGKIAKPTSRDYMNKISKLLIQTFPEPEAEYNFTFKNVFGAVAIYVDNTIFATYGNFGFALKLPPETILSLFKKRGYTPLKYFPNGHIKKEYVVLPQKLLKNVPEMKRLIIESIKYIQL